ncbi:BrnT family toxin [Methylobacterium sp. A54F]
MDDGYFQWDDAKATANVAKHGVTFEMARDAFRDPFALDWPDERFAYGESRSILVGMVEGYLLYVAYTMRNDVIRIVSARAAGPQERRRYHEANA